jgi:hypothetical protein
MQKRLTHERYERTSFLEGIRLNLHCVPAAANVIMIGIQLAFYTPLSNWIRQWERLRLRPQAFDLPHKATQVRLSVARSVCRL